MSWKHKAMLIGVVGASVLAALTWWAVQTYDMWSEHNEALRESRQAAAAVRSKLREVQDRMQDDTPPGVVLVHSRGAESSGDQVNWTTRWDIAAIRVNMEDPKSSVKQQIVNLRIHWRSRPDGEAVIEWGEAPNSREAAEMLGSLLEAADIRFSIREVEKPPSGSAATN